MGCACNKGKGPRKSISPGFVRREASAVNSILRSAAATAGIGAVTPTQTTDAGRQRINRIRAAAIRQQFGR